MLNKIGKKIQRDGVVDVFSTIAFRSLRWFCRPSIQISIPPAELLTLGSEYGGWTFLVLPSLRNSKIVSCGAGEDISFDICFADRFDAQVIIVDPTPRAVSYVKMVFDRVGRPADCEFVEGGSQPVCAYDMSRLTREQLVLYESAIWIRRGTVSFFPPLDPKHVSHSIVDIQGTRTSDFSNREIEVRSATIRDIMCEFGIERIALIKLDIEGAEISVLEAMLKDGVLPQQILVEFDGLNFPSLRHKILIGDTDKILRSAGYLCYHTNGHANFLYALADEVSKSVP